MPKVARKRSSDDERIRATHPRLLEEGQRRKRQFPPRWQHVSLLAALGAGAPLCVAGLAAQDTPVRIDYLTFAQGAVPLNIEGPGATLGPNHEHQVFWIDGDATPRGFIMTQDMDVFTDFIYELPAPTTFDRLAVPEITEVPSPYTTFTRRIEVLGSAVGPNEGYETLAVGTLETHRRSGEVTELTVVATPAVRWIKLKLEGGIQVLEEQMGMQFSEIIGNGTQDTPETSEHFTGAWDSRFVKMELVQDGPLVSAACAAPTAGPSACTWDPQ